MSRPYDCTTCGLTFTASNYGPLPHWCPECRPYTAPRRIPRQRPAPNEPRLIHAMALAIVDQRLAIQTARHALTLAALARQLGWDDATWLQAAHDALHELTTIKNAAA